MANHAQLGPWVRRFLLEHLIVERNLSVNTQHSYRDTLRLLLPYVASKAGTRIDRLKVDDITPALVRQSLLHLERDRQCGIGTRNQRLAAVHALARFIGEHSPEHLDWCAQVRLIPHKRGTRALISYLTEAEMCALLGAPDRSKEQGYRDYVLLLFLYNSGARASEAASLLIQDVDTRSRLVRITGKGNKKRICPLWPETVGHLRRLIAERSKDESLFRNRLRQPLTRFGIHTLVERHAAHAAEREPSVRSKRVSPHTIRHSTATHLLRAGVDINTIRGWLGHASINTTNVYAEVDLDAKAKALAACSPGSAWISVTVEVGSRRHGVSSDFMINAPMWRRGPVHVGSGVTGRGARLYGVSAPSTPSGRRRVALRVARPNNVAHRPRSCRPRWLDT
jgi:site-specific recombinase XerD